MITRQHSAEGCLSQAQYSPCARYRYGLSRSWDAQGGTVLFVMLNPSTADERRNDPTIERCERRARQMGFGRLQIANLCAWRATRPADLKRAEDPIGPENDDLLVDWHAKAALTIASWGVHGTLLGRDQAVLALLRGPLHHLGQTQQGHPRHPLYVPYSTQPMLWER